MKKLYLYTVFHGNLQYSAIPQADYELILDKGFWQILKISSELGVKLGFELTSWTLRLLRDRDPLFIKELKESWENKRCEIVGSSYSQTIFPIIPALVNKHGLDLAVKDYREILGKVPEIVFVNEQTYGGGLPRLYKDAGYKAIVMEWENTAGYNNYPEKLFYRSPKVIGMDGTELSLLWSSTNATRWFFDEYAKGRKNLKEYVAYIRGHYSKSEDRVFPFYCGDWEIFDYMPFDYGELKGNREIERLRELFKYLLREDWVEFMLPSDIVKKFKIDREVKIVSTQCPVVSGGPETYSASRWAVSGIDDVTLNTQCHQILEGLKKIEYLRRHHNLKVDSMEDKWRVLNFVWGSDLKTQVTAEKLIDSRNKIGVLLDDTDKILKGFNKRTRVKSDFSLMNTSEYDWEGGVHVLPLKFTPGRFKESILVKHGNVVIPSQLEEARRYSDGSVRSANLVLTPYLKKGEKIDCKLVGKARTKKGTEFEFVNNRLESKKVIVEFEPRVGGRIKGLIFPQVSSQTLAGAFEYGFYANYTGDFVLKPEVSSILSDSQPTEIEIDKNAEDWTIRVPLRCRIDLGLVVLLKTYLVYLNEPRVDIRYRFFIKNIRPLFFRIGGMTINPAAFNRKRLKYVSINGGWTPEGFHLSGKTIKQDELIGVQNEWSSTSLTTIQHCIGATDGWLDINDGEKGITIATDKALLYSVFLIHYEEKADTYLLKTTASIGEHDSTGPGFWKGWYDFVISIIGHKGSCSRNGVCAAGINHKLITLFPEGLKVGGNV